MDEEEAHKQLIRKGFEVSFHVENLMAEDQLAVLKKYGSWLQALEKREISPLTEEQERFISVCDGSEPPHNVIEVAWYNYKQITSRIRGESFKFDRSGTEGENQQANSCNACGRKLDYCVCSQ